MKKLILLFITSVTLLSITSCSNDDDNSSASIEGKWEFSKFGYSLGGQEFLFDYEHSLGCTKDYVIITSNTTTNHSFFNNGTSCEEEIDNVTYTRNGNVLTSSNGEDVEIISISNTTLKFKILYESENEELPVGATALMVLKRIN